MNKTINYTLMLSLLALLIVAGCTKSPSAAAVNSKTQLTSEGGELRHLVLEIKGMYCASCGPGLAKMISEVDGVLLAKVSNAKDKGEVIYDSSKIRKEQIVGMFTDPYSAKVLSDIPATQDMIDSLDALKSN